MRQMFLTLGDLILQILETPIPVVGVIKGHAIGVAKTLFCACDYRYAANGRVLIGVPEILLGVPEPLFRGPAIEVRCRRQTGERLHLHGPPHHGRGWSASRPGPSYGR